MGSADLEEIERHNVLGASWLAMRRALDALTVKPAICLVDGRQRPDYVITDEGLESQQPVSDRPFFGRDEGVGQASQV